MGHEIEYRLHETTLMNIERSTRVKAHLLFNLQKNTSCEHCSIIHHALSLVGPVKRVCEFMRVEKRENLDARVFLNSRMLRSTINRESVLSSRSKEH